MEHISFGCKYDEEGRRENYFVVKMYDLKLNFLNLPLFWRGVGTGYL